MSPLSTHFCHKWSHILIRFVSNSASYLLRIKKKIVSDFLLYLSKKLIGFVLNFIPRIHNFNSVKTFSPLSTLFTINWVKIAPIPSIHSRAIFGCLLGGTIANPAWLWNSQPRVATPLGLEKSRRIEFSLGWIFMDPKALKSMSVYVKGSGTFDGT